MTRICQNNGDIRQAGIHACHYFNISKTIAKPCNPDVLSMIYKSYIDDKLPISAFNTTLLRSSTISEVKVDVCHGDIFE